MEKMKFNPCDYKGRDIISVKTTYTGIRALYRWNPDTKKYFKKTEGNKFSATIKLYGQQREKYFERKEDAIRWRSSGGREERIQKTMVFEELLQRYLLHAKSRINPSTFQTYQNNSKHLKFFNGLKVEAITSQMIDQWLIRMKAKDYVLTQKSTRLSYEKEVALLRQMFGYYSEYLKDGFIIPVKIRHLQDCIINSGKYKEAQAKNRTRHMTPDQVESFLVTLHNYAIEGQSSFGFYCLALLQLQTGARIGEACSLSWCDIDFEAKSVILAKSVQWKRGKGTETYIQPYTKTGEPRVVWLTEPIVRVLKEWKVITGREGLIFSKNGIEPFSYRAIQHAYDKAFKALGQKWRSTHILRHTFSTDFLRLTRDHISLSKILVFFSRHG